MVLMLACLRYLYDTFPMPTPESVPGYDYPPFSIVHDPEIRRVHEVVQEHTTGMNRVEEAHWVHHMLDYPDQPKGQKRRGYAPLDERNPFLKGFIRIADHSPEHAGNFETPGQVVGTVALRTYAFARLEYTKRFEEAEEPFKGDQGLSRMLHLEAAQLSNVLRKRYLHEPDKPDLLLLAHEISILGARYRQPDAAGYSQTMGHWLHLQYNKVNPDFPRTHPGSEAEADAHVRRLKLILALEELGWGPQNLYVKDHVVRDLLALYTVIGRDEEAATLEGHFAAIPSLKEPPSKAHERN
jgi:hypothetical protein